MHAMKKNLEIGCPSHMRTLMHTHDKAIPSPQGLSRSLRCGSSRFCAGRERGVNCRRNGPRQRAVARHAHSAFKCADPGWSTHVQTAVNLVTALVPSLTACLDSSPGRMRRIAVWISRDVTVGFLL